MFHGGKCRAFFLHRRVFTQMKKETVTTNQITEGVIWKQLLLFFFSHCSGNIFFSSCTTRQIRSLSGVLSAKKLLPPSVVPPHRLSVSDRGILRRTGFRCFGYYFPVLWCEGQSAAEPCPAYCLCILYRWKYFHHRSGNSDRSLDA